MGELHAGRVILCTQATTDLVPRRAPSLIDGTQSVPVEERASQPIMEDLGCASYEKEGFWGTSI